MPSLYADHVIPVLRNWHQDSGKECDIFHRTRWHGAGIRLKPASKSRHSGKVLLVFSYRYKLIMLNVSHWRPSLSGFRQVHALGGVSGTPPVMTRTMATHG
jgi:hypothetical protein